MLIPRMYSRPDFRTFAPGRKSYYAGRWYVRYFLGRYSVPAYVSPGRRPPRVSARGPIHVHSKG